MTQPDGTHRVFLGLGSNINPESYLPRAVSCLRKFLQVEAVSSAWQSSAIGSDGPDFLNAVVQVKTNLLPQQLKHEVTCRIEEELNRVRTDDKYAPRTIDIDILIFDSQVIDPEIWQFAHHSVPLAELLPDLTNPYTLDPLITIAERQKSASGIVHRPDVLMHARID